MAAKHNWATRMGNLGYTAAIVALALFVLAGPGHRFGILPARAAVLCSAAAMLVGVFAVICVILGLILPTGPGGKRSPAHRLVLALVVGGGLAGLVGLQTSRALTLPRIHDITTDTRNPPQFVALVGARAGAANPLAYPGEQVATLQQTAYPNVTPVSVSGRSVSEALDVAESVAIAQGWEGVIRVESAQQIEATDISFWFGFKDDIVIRAQQEGNGVAIDVRSKSRVGVSDLGANAARIERYLEDLRNALAAP